METSIYKSVADFKKSDKLAYEYAKRNNHLDELCEIFGWSKPNLVYLTQKPKDYWTKERCLEEALKYKHKVQWRKASVSSYQTTIKNGWYDECCRHMTKLQTQNPPLTWENKERCLENARLYETPSKWNKCSAGAYSSAKKNGWYGECVAHMSRRKTLPNRYWCDKNNCLNDAKKYTYYGDWFANSATAYTTSKRMGWFKECAKHMTMRPRCKNKLAKVKKI